MPVRRYSTARSGLLKLARKACSTYEAMTKWITRTLQVVTGRTLKSSETWSCVIQQVVMRFKRQSCWRIKPPVNELLQYRYKDNKKGNAPIFSPQKPQLQPQWKKETLSFFHLRNRNYNHDKKRKRSHFFTSETAITTIMKKKGNALIFSPRKPQLQP
jgi:hypothetical protein